MAGVKNIFDVVGRSMGAQIVRMNTIASNLANMESKASTSEDAFKPIRPVFETVFSDNYNENGIATVDAMRIGRLHCFVPTWEDASVSFLLSGGFSPSEKVSGVIQDTLVLWGEKDEILEPSTAAKFEETLPSSTIQWCNSGHVPHLEQPQEVADAIVKFLS